ncbi:MAG: hypothetical protein HYR56_34530 [Acidobacteria bacterium]|nr:hypothetical protein [Acidobacteriota bacterium]MBI3423671.1 hypothetical protein [Acidobacteriota bacterium]
MKTTRLQTCLGSLYLLLCLLPVAAPPQARQSAKPTVQALGWISGCWENTRGKRYNEEHWMKAAGNTMLGMSRTLNDGNIREFEFLRIHEGQGADQGNIYYTSKPSGQPEASFKLVSWKESEAIFENPAHDFPQRIIYRRTGDAMQARIEGKMNGQERGVDFPFTRAKCDAVLTN